MSDLSEEEKKKEKQEKVKLEMFDDAQKQKLKAKEEGKQSLHSQMAQKVGPTDCIIVVGTTGLGKSTCVNLYTGQVLVMTRMMMLLMMTMMMMMMMMMMRRRRSWPL